MKKEMLISVAQPEECRIAIVENGILEELFIERASQDSYVGNIYKGKIVNIEGSIQAAFVDFGIGRNGFLHVSDVDPAYYKHLLPRDVLARMESGDDDDQGARPNRTRDRGPERERGPRREREPQRDREPPPMKAWLAPAAPPSEPDDAEASGFGSDERAETPPPLPAPVARAKPVAPASHDDEDDDGFGSGLNDAPPPQPARVAVVETVTDRKPAAPADDSAEDSDFGMGLDFDEKPAAGPEAKAKAPRARRAPRKKADEEPAPEAEPEKKPARPRRSAKKKDDGDDETKPMPGAERRTHPPGGEPELESDFGSGLDGEEPPLPTDFAGEEEAFEDDEDGDEGLEDGEDIATDDEDEGEIQPFAIDHAAAEFDPNAPNDRFSGDSSQAAKPRRERDRKKPARHDEPGEDEPAPVAAVDDEDDFSPYGKGRDEPEERPDQRGGRGGRLGDRGGRSSGGPPRRDGRPSGPPGSRPAGGMGSRPGGGRDRTFPRMPIEKIFKRGQEVIVQVIKEGIGTKGPTLSTFVSIAGRYLVLMPSLARFGVSRKIEDFDARRRLREIMNDLNPPKGVGFIVRTAAIDRNPTELQNDLAYLLRLWQVMVKRIKRVQGAVEIYRESDMITRTIRDNFSADIDAVWVDEPEAYQHASEFMQVVMPKYADRIKLHDTVEPLFHKHRLEEELSKINQKRIEMPQGGSIIIEQTEALVAIDVNSGNFRGDNNAEENAFRMNVLAAKEIARQLRLRDLGGVIVNDFIDMRDEKHRRIVEDTLRDALKRDKARTKILRISQFGIIEMTRQRMQPSLKKRVYDDCTSCKGTGFVKTNETMSIEVMRTLQLAAHRALAGVPPVASVQLTVHMDVAYFLLNRKRRDIAALEDKARIDITVHGALGVSPDLMDLKCFDPNGNEVRLVPTGPPPRMFQPGGRPPRGNDRRFPASTD